MSTTRQASVADLNCSACFLALNPSPFCCPQYFPPLRSQIYAVSLVGMWFIDIIWLSLWAGRIDTGKVRVATEKEQSLALHPDTRRGKITKDKSAVQYQIRVSTVSSL